MFEICFYCKKKGSQIPFSSPLPADETPKRWEFHNFVYVCVQNVPTVDSTQEMSQSDSPTRGPTHGWLKRKKSSQLSKRKTNAIMAFHNAKPSIYKSCCGAVCVVNDRSKNSRCCHHQERPGEIRIFAFPYPNPTHWDISHLRYYCPTCNQRARAYYPMYLDEMRKCMKIPMEGWKQAKALVK